MIQNILWGRICEKGNSVVEQNNRQQTERTRKKEVSHESEGVSFVAEI